MGFLSATRRFVVREAGYIVGANGVTLGWRVLREQFSLARRKRCPVCRRGRLFPVDHEASKALNGLRAAGCSECAYYEVEGRSEEALARARDMIQSDPAYVMSEGDKQKARRSLKMLSRGCYLFALLLMVLDVCTLIQGGSLLFVFNSFGLILVLFSWGFSSSYRHYQIEHGLHFVPGALKQFLRTGNWLV